MVSGRGSLLPGVLIGFIVILLLGSLPVLGPVIGGFISGLVARGGLRGGCMAGLFAGIFGAIVVSAIRILGGSLLFGIPGFFTMLGDQFIIVIAILYFGLIGALGGALAGALFG